MLELKTLPLACAETQRPVRQLERALASIGAGPALKLNDQVFWSAGDIERALQADQRSEGKRT